MRFPLGMVHGTASSLLIILLVIWELTAPAVRRPSGVLRHWARNVTVGGIGIFLTHVIPGATLLAISGFGRSLDLGLLKGLPTPLAVILTVLLLDLAVWTQHRASHVWPWLWRLHQVHHGDQTLDLSTAFRFHPLELCVSLAWKSLVVLLLGGPTAGVLLSTSGKPPALPGRQQLFDRNGSPPRKLLM